MVPSACYALQNKRVWVAGHNGLVGSALVRRLKSESCEILTVSRRSVDLRERDAVDRYLEETKPHAIFLAAAKVGGIHANESYPADFLRDNLAIELNVVDAAYRAGVEKLMMLGSSCIYPRLAPQPIPEDALMTGPLEPTNEWYAIAKIAGIKLAQAYRKQFGCDFISAMPTNLYGPGDNFDLAASHVVPALIAKAHEARTGGARALMIWGSGTPRRELLYSDDAADGLVFLMKHYSEPEIVNLGTGADITVSELAKLICRIVGYAGPLRFDSGKPDGTPRKLLDVSRMTALGWRAATPLEDGLEKTYRWYVEHCSAEPALARA